MANFRRKSTEIVDAEPITANEEVDLPDVPNAKVRVGRGWWRLRGGGMSRPVRDEVFRELYEPTDAEAQALLDRTPRV